LKPHHDWESIGINVLRKPWLQFFALGLLLFLTSQRLFPEPKPVLGPPNAERLAAMVENYARFAQGSVSPELLSRFVETELRDELLFREAVLRELQFRDAAVEQRIIRNMRFLDAQSKATDQALLEQGYALRLHLTDEVIRRRLVQIMERLIVGTTAIALPTDDDIQSRYDRDLETWLEPARYTFSHVFLTDERSQEMSTLISKVSDENLNPEAARMLGSPFLSGYTFRQQSPDQIARVFGASFSEQLAAMTPKQGGWVGPMTSAFGVHYVYIQAFTPARTLQMSEVSEGIARDLAREAETQAVTDWVTAAMARYEVRRQ
jgi:hypothetical protein